MAVLAVDSKKNCYIVLREPRKKKKNKGRSPRGIGKKSLSGFVARSLYFAKSTAIAGRRFSGT